MFGARQIFAQHSIYSDFYCPVKICLWQSRIFGRLSRKKASSCWSFHKVVKIVAWGDSCYKKLTHLPEVRTFSQTFWRTICREEQSTRCLKNIYWRVSERNTVKSHLRNASNDFKFVCYFLPLHQFYTVFRNSQVMHIWQFILTLSTYKISRFNKNL